MATYTVLTDGLTWSQPGWNPQIREHRFAKRGEQVEISKEVLQTFSAEQRAALGTEDDLAALDAQPEGWVQKPDDEIGAMTLEEIAAYLDRAPEELHETETERVVELEQGRDRPRKGVLALLSADGDEDDDEDDGLPPQG